MTLGFTLTLTFLCDPTSWRPRLPVLQFYVGFGAPAARYLGLSSSHWCRVWCYRGWTIAMQCWLAFHYTLHGACNRWWTPPHGSSSRRQSATTSRRSYAKYTGWKFHGQSGLQKWPGTVVPRWRTSSPQQSLSFEGVCVPLRLTNCLFPVPDAQPTATELFRSPLYGSGTVFRSIYHVCSVTSCLPLSLDDILLQLCYPWLLLSCQRRDTVICWHVNRSYLLTYLLTDLHLSRRNVTWSKNLATQLTACTQSICFWGQTV